MQPAVLNELRLLSAMQFDARILLTVVFAGDPRLSTKLRRDDLLPLASRIRTRLLMEYAARDELMACLNHLQLSAGNATLMSPQLMNTPCDHAVGNYRMLTSMAAELLASAARQELTRLVEKLYLQVFASPSPKARQRA